MLWLCRDTDDISRFFFFFFNDTATTEIYTLSLHDALPILGSVRVTTKHQSAWWAKVVHTFWPLMTHSSPSRTARSEEHTSELQSRQYLVCRLLLEKKNKTTHDNTNHSLL